VGDAATRQWIASGISAADILARLKAETRPEHVALESSLSLTGNHLTLEGYRQRLGQFLGLYEPLEQALAAIDGWGEHGIDLGPRLKASRLEADLLALGERRPERLPRCPAPVTLTDLTAGFGCLYVVEGASLGGQIITRQLRDAFGITPDNGGSFFHGYGERTAAMWRCFRCALLEFATTSGVEDGIVASAMATFRLIRQWCEGSHEA
jgi:heme oxygenase